ncbi:unnamed protein product [Cochlearia groenlandica]
MKMFLRCFKPKFYKKSKSTTSYMKIRLDNVRKKRVAMVKFLKMDIVNFLKNGHDFNAYTRAEVLLEELRIISCYDIIERFCDCISENLSLMLKKRECPEECREAVSSLIYAAAWVPDVPELKELRTVFTRRFGTFIDSYVNHELVEKTELRIRPSQELKIQTVREIAKEFSINWDTTNLNKMLLKQTSSLQIDTRRDNDSNIETEIREDEQSDNESSVLSQSWTRDSLSKGSFSSSSSSNPNSPIRRESKKKSVDQENSRLLGSQGSENVTRNNEENERTASFQMHNKLLDYDEVVARLATLRRR